MIKFKILLEDMFKIITKYNLSLFVFFRKKMFFNKINMLFFVFNPNILKKWFFKKQKFNTY